MIVGLFIGLIVGASLGVLLMAIFIADAREEDYLRQIQHTCTVLCDPSTERHYSLSGERIA